MAFSVSALGRAYKVQHTIPVSVTVRLPLPQLTVDSVLNVLKAPLKSTAERIYTALFEVGVKTLEAKNQSGAVKQVVIHQPVEVLAVHLGISRVTFYKHLKVLNDLGLVASRGHTTAYGGLARKDGTLFAISLKPGHTARLRYEDLKHKWRDLTADIQSGTRTAWSFLQGLQSSNPTVREVQIDHLVSWAVNPGLLDRTPVKSDCKGDLQEYIYSLDLLMDTHPKDRGSMVDTYARALASGFLDAHNINFWRHVLWQSIKCEWQGLGTSYQVQNALTRLQADRDEWMGLRSPGALLVSRLKKAGVWDLLKSVK